MTRNTPRTAAGRTLMIVAPALLATAATIGIAGAMRAPGASAGVRPVSPPTCVTDDLSGTVYGQPGHPDSGVRDAVLLLTNTSGRTCQVTGRPGIAMVTPPGELVSVPTTELDQPVGDAAIVLKPEAGAWSRVQWDTCEAGRTGCGVGVALQYLVDPESTGTVADMDGVPEADRDGITMRALRVGPLQRTRAAALR